MQRISPRKGGHGKTELLCEKTPHKTKIGAAPHRDGSFSVWRRGCAVSRQRYAARKKRCAERKNAAPQGKPLYRKEKTLRRKGKPTDFSHGAGCPRVFRQPKRQKAPTVSHKNPGGFLPRTRFRPLFCLRCDPSFPGVFLFSRFQSRGANSRTARCRIRSGSVSSASFGRISRHSGKSARMLSRTESTVGDP